MMKCEDGVALHQARGEEAVGEERDAAMGGGR